MPSILAIDPGTYASAYVLWDGGAILDKGIVSNDGILYTLSSMANSIDLLAIEMIGHYGTGMPAGKTVFETCIWIGRFVQAYGKSCFLIKRKAIVTYLCNSPRAKDSNVRQALIDKYGDPKKVEVPVLDDDGNQVMKRNGQPKTTKVPGSQITFGLSKDLWAALALADFVFENYKLLHNEKALEKMKGVIHVTE